MSCFRLALIPLAVVSFMLVAAGCSDSPSGLQDEVDVTDSVKVDLPLDAGSVGLVFDTRQMFKRGYKPAKVAVSLPDYPTLDASLDVDPSSSLAVLAVESDDLTEAQLLAFGSGVSVSATVTDELGTVLADYQSADEVLDDSNVPLSLTTTLPFIPRPLHLQANVPYLLQPAGMEGVITSLASDAYEPRAYIPGNFEHQFYFNRVGGADENKYTMHHLGYEEGSTFIASETNAGWIILADDFISLPPEGALVFVLEQDEDGWVRFRLDGTSEYMYVSPDADGILRHGTADATRFRLISDDINWLIVDRGTVFHEPLTPPAKLDFAFEATIRNCSPATITETIGKSESRTTSATTTTTESVQLFSSEEFGVEVMVGVEVGGGVAGFAEVSGNVSTTTNYGFTTSETTSSENTFSEETQETAEVSRERQVQVPPYTAVEVFDAVRTLDNVRVPFTQELRISGTYEDGTVVSGDEIITQMLFNFVGGVPTDVRDGYVDFSVRGRVDIEQMFEVQTDANELVGACE